MYLDPEVFALERARVFGGPAWVGVGGLHQLREPGAYFTATVAGEPIVVVRDADGALRAFFNVCPHRGGPLARGAGKLRGVLQCLYHGWTFGLDGALLRARDFGGEADFDPAACGLRPLRVETWLQSVFVALDPAAPPLGDYLGDLRGRIARYALDDYAYAFSKDFELPVNWKVAWETAAESYHLPIVHPQLRFDPRRFREEIGRCYSLQVSLPPEADQAKGDGGREPLESLVVNLFPNTFLIVPSRVRWDRPYFKATYLLPLGVDSTLYRSDFYIPRERLGDDAWLAPLHAAWDEVNRQDREICEELQRGIRSTAYEPGPLSLRWERALHHFHELLMTRLRGEAAAPKEA
ncbi:MAG TPA: aromatic ring-hydroxylating dioxygenase subunit alpha [Thermodesulfobacteriota bacterium]